MDETTLIILAILGSVVVAIVIGYALRHEEVP